MFNFNNNRIIVLDGVQWELKESCEGVDTLLGRELRLSLHLPKRLPRTTPRPHAELIKQWADDDSLIVEYEALDSWREKYYHIWHPDTEYRLVNLKQEKQKKIAVLKAEQDRLQEEIEELENGG
jgi:hypothetical protein